MIDNKKSMNAIQLSNINAAKMSVPLVSRNLLCFFLALQWISHNVSVVVGQECTADGKKCDTHEQCAIWSKDGECVKNRTYMLKHCPASCASYDVSNNFDPTSVGTKCEDKHKFCSIWAEHGECEENAFEMNRFCAKSCKVCVPTEEEDRELTTAAEKEGDKNDHCKNNHDNCEAWAKAGECKVNPNYMTINCAKSCDTCAKLEPIVDPETSRLEAIAKASENFGTKQSISGDRRKDVAKLIQDSIHYMEDPKTKQLPEKVLSGCQNRNELCAFWALIGECENNPSYMTTNCAPSCKTCDLIDIQNRCPPLTDATPALYPGDLNKMFYNIINNAPGNKTDLSKEERKDLEENKIPMYTVHVHSRPGKDVVTEVSVVMDKSLQPWVVTFDNFLTADECMALIELGHKHEYKRSEDVGAEKFDGTHEGVKSERRTSENAWCSSHIGCRNETIPTLIHDRIAKVLGIPPENSEDFQILKYEKGQFYRTHHDFIQHQVDRQCGPRILTFFMYLSNVEEGGGTNFPSLDITIQPKRGTALLWPSVLNAEPMAKDGRTQHQALDVKKGIKYAANGWIHMYDYITPQKKGCS